jgi:hypothetical protein
MRNVKIRMRGADLSREMAAMREWLDRNQYEPARFDCDQNGVDVVVSVDFMLDEAAEAFASRFVAVEGAQGSAPSARNGSRQSTT